MPAIFSSESKEFFRNQLRAFQSSFAHEIVNPIASDFRLPGLPAALESLNVELADLHDELGRHGIGMNATFLPLLKLIILSQRRKLAADIDSRLGKTTNPEVIEALKSTLHHFDLWMEQRWLHETTALRMPRLSDFLNLEELEKRIPPPPSRKYDEKLGILQTPTLLKPDLAYYREACADRGLPVGLAFLDIDDFKSFNTKYIHQTVDRDVLPVVMRALEAFTFARGHAYRFGGDEYAVLLPNGLGSENVFDDLRQTLQNLSFSGISENLTVCVGACVIKPDCFLTESETVDRANKAMMCAKEKGKKNCVAMYQGELFRDQDIVLVPQK